MQTYKVKFRTFLGRGAYKTEGGVLTVRIPAIDKKTARRKATAFARAHSPFAVKYLATEEIAMGLISVNIE